MTENNFIDLFNFVDFVGGVFHLKNGSDLFFVYVEQFLNLQQVLEAFLA
jgi:hypothetical protein